MSCDESNIRDECLPLDSFQELLDFVPEIIQPGWPTTALRTQPYKFEKCSNQVFNIIQQSEDKAPKTLLCHDMRGGYLEDRFRNGCYDLSEEPYRFIHWSNIDIFVYFSHHFITIPPRQWINSAHKNGVPILGTIITEVEPGEKLCADFLKDESTVDTFVKSVLKVTQDLKFDGWLVNIENKLSEDQVTLMTKLLKDLTAKLKESNPNALVIWYDAVTREGKLDWQNELNDRNKIFFDCCDGIFLNYTWKVENLENSISNLDDLRRRFDVFVGVDVFGRGCIGGGGFECKVPLELIREKNLSVALFAPGWTHEVHPKDEIYSFPNREYKFWSLLMPYLFTRGPVIDSSCPEFQTFFCPGFGQNLDQSWWLNLGCQDFQPSLLAYSQPGHDARLPFSIFNRSDTEDIVNVRKPFNLILEQNSSDATWKIGDLENVIPLFLCKIPCLLAENKKVQFSMYAKCTRSPVLAVRTYLDSEGSKNLRHARVSPRKPTNEAEKDSDKSGFEHFVFDFIPESREETIIDFVGVEVFGQTFAIRSFGVKIVALEY